MKINLVKTHSKVALGYFLIIALLGVFLRLFSIIPVDFNYKFIVHAHSHVALLGWLYSGFMLLIYSVFLQKTDVTKQYIRLFWLTQVTILGMLFTFPFTGYALFSITFSTLFLIASYYFSYLVFKHTPHELKKRNSYKCIRISLWYMIISSIGPWALGAIMNTLGSSSSWYKNAIYFYLHFQYNGWFILAIIGVLFNLLEQRGINITKKVFNRFFKLFNVGVVLTFAISILWMKLHTTVNIIAGIGGLIQLIAIVMLLTYFRSKNIINNNAITPITKFVFRLVLVFFLIKLVLQLVGTLPNIAEITSQNIDFVIGYLHWIFLGVVSLSLLGLLNVFNYIKLTKATIIFFVCGFLFIETLLFYRGFSAWMNLSLITNFDYYLFLASCLLLLAILFILMLQAKKIG